MSGRLKFNFLLLLVVNSFLCLQVVGVAAAAEDVAPPAAPLPPLPSGAPPTIKLGQTKVIGKQSNTTGGLVDFYGGIPFAKPPIDKLRLKRSILLDPASPEFSSRYPEGVLNATSFGLSCLQGGLPESQVSEDCLTVNVWRPAGIPAHTKLPVMVWIYGGAFIGGSSSFFDGSGLVARSLTRGTPIILASLNYRVGPLGFPPGSSAKKSKILNLGLYDQLVSLEWLKQNIGHFGGDSNKLTIFGESAGGTSIQFLLTDPKGRLAEYVRGAIIESAAYPIMYPPEREQGSWNAFVSGVPSCRDSSGADSDLECILSAPTSQLYGSIQTLPGFITTSPYQPVIDTVSKDSLIPNFPSVLLQNLKGKKISVMIGANLDEGTVFSPQSIASNSDIQNLLINATSPTLPTTSPSTQNAYVQGLIDIYPENPSLNSPFNTGNETFGLSPSWKKYNSLWGDLLFHSGRRLTARKLSSLGHPTYSYHFIDPNAGSVLVGFPLPYLGVFHTTEIPFLTNERGLVNPSTETLSRSMQDYWISFATSQNPNDKHGDLNRPTWPAYKSGPFAAGPGSLLELNGASSKVIKDDYRTKEIEYLLSRQDILQR